MTDVANRSIRFGVASRLLSAFAAITIFAIATSVIALYTFGKYGDGFNRIASSNVPALVAASNLAQRSQALAANAPNLAVADGHFARRAVSEALRGQLQAIAEASEQVKALAPATEGLESLIQNQASLGGKLEKLDALVAEKLETDRVAANLMLRLRTLSVRIQSASGDMLSKITGEPRAQIDALSAWTTAAEQAIVIMLSTSSADTTIRLNQLRSEFEDIRNRSQNARGKLSSTVFEEIDALEQILAQYGRGAPNIFDVRACLRRPGNFAGHQGGRGPVRGIGRTHFHRYPAGCPFSERLFRQPYCRLLPSLHNIVFAMCGRGVWRISLYQSFDRPAAA
jgi:hypothetical protein